MNIKKALTTVLRYTQSEPSSPKQAQPATTGQAQASRPTVYHLAKSQAPNPNVDIAVRDTDVAYYFSPDVVMDENGVLANGLDTKMVAQYLTATTASLADANLGHVEVTWNQQVGRFVTVTFNIVAWDHRVDILYPVNVISHDLANAFKTYQSAMASQLRQIHRRNQDFTHANRLFDKAIAQVNKLVDDRQPHVTRPELLFILTAMMTSKYSSAPQHLHGTERGSLIGTTHSVTGAK